MNTEHAIELGVALYCALVAVGVTRWFTGLALKWTMIQAIRRQAPAPAGAPKEPKR